MNNIHNIKSYTLKGLIVLVLTLVGVGGGLLTSCIEEESPTDQLQASAVGADELTQRNLLYGISAYMVKYNSYGSSGYYYNDWGYPCEMFFREICTQDFVYSDGGTLNYWSYKENASSTGYEVYRWNYYYRLIRNCNALISNIDPQTASATSKQYLAQALLFRALAYMDLAREFEYKPTGYPEIDNTAKSNGIYGLTVPIVTSDMTIEEIQNNERAPFFTMYRFIMTDLNNAAAMLGDSFSPDDVSLPGSGAAYGLMARAWMEIGSRMDNTIEVADLKEYGTKIQEYDALNNGYDRLGVTTPAECYAKASACADKVINSSSYSLMTKTQWQSRTEGFNAANAAWIWRCRIGDVTQEPAYYFSFPGTVCSEIEGGLPYDYSSYRCISSTLFDQISKNDWRKASWVDPQDTANVAAEGNTPAVSHDVVNKYNSLLDSIKFKNICAYANLKFRPNGGDVKTTANWLLGDYPLMRIEEMYYIKAEAEARQGNWSKAQAALNTVVGSRYETSYTCSLSNLEKFMTELMQQKRIEFWGEGIIYFDYKRLNLQIDRTKVTNTLDQNKIASLKGYCAPWLNFFIYNSETGRNKACKPNPDTANYFETE